MSNSDENVITYALFPEVSTTFFKNKGNADFFEKEPLEFIQTESEIYKVSIDGKNYNVEYAKNMDPIIHNSSDSLASINKNVKKEMLGQNGLSINAPLGGNIFKVEFEVGDEVAEDDAVIILEAMKMETAIKPPKSGTICAINVSQGDKVNPGDSLFEIVLMSFNEIISSFGIFSITTPQVLMLCVGLLLLYLAISKKFEPLLLLPIGFGAILTNIPEIGLSLSPIERLLYENNIEDIQALVAIINIELINLEGYIKTASYIELNQLNNLALNMGYKAGILYTFYNVAIGSGIAPLLIFMGVGAMTDFGPLLANPKTLILGAAAQFGIFATVLGALLLDQFGIISFSLKQAAATGIIGGADGPTAIYVSSILAPELLGAIAVAAYSYMALVPLIQPPIMRALTTDKERVIEMVQLREVSQREKIIFPISLLLIVGLLLPSAAPLLGMLCLGNLMKESLVVERLSEVAQNSLINIVTIFLGLSVGSKLAADKFLTPETLGILLLGIVAFAIGTASGILVAKLMNVFSKNKVNPLIGAAGVSAVPMAARVANKVGLEYNSQNYLLMHAMGPNIAGVIGSAVAAGVMIKFLA